MSHPTLDLELLEARVLLSTYTVDTFEDVIDANDGLTSLREAVIAANADAGEDTIVLAAGTYTLSIAPDGYLDVHNDRTGDLDAAHRRSSAGLSLVVLQKADVTAHGGDQRHLILAVLFDIARADELPDALGGELQQGARLGRG